ncbi:malonyl-[acyl-carrier protein] O-methyltransferase 2-like [Oppia nitens]|uniref:malonyl-[acyl-carrier protein] O-methyltransferase 2-like n=1 Tax=Oppia nitens TaxID=1686743 RepID=UPI0023DCDEB5|nr:malonyl-[acyl-carrier protein] O-methyltransferase 2-like [Oppia nitens]
MEFNVNKYNKSNKLQVRDANDLIKRINNENIDKKYDIILDIGCGTGNITQTLNDKLSVDHIYGVDVDTDMIEFARQHHPKPNITYLSQDISVDWDQLSPQIRSLESKVSLIFTNHCFHWIVNKENAVKNIERLLNKSAKIYANIYWIIDPFYLNLSDEELVIHRKEFMNIPTKEKQLDIWIKLFNGSNLSVISYNFLLKSAEYELKSFEENVLPLSTTIRKQYIVDYEKDTQLKNDKIKAQVLANVLKNKIVSATFGGRDTTG